MDADDFEALYRELRGSRSSHPIMDAKSAFTDRDYERSQSLLTEAYETYKESRQRILRQDPEKQVEAKAPDRERQVRRLKRKQEKAQELIDQFEKLLPQLEKLVDRQRARQQRAVEKTRQLPSEDPAPSKPSVDEELAAKRLSVHPDFEKHFVETRGDDQLAVVSKHYAFRAVSRETDVQTGHLYLLRDGGRSVLIVAEKNPLAENELLCIDYFDPAMTVPMSPATMVQLSENRKLVMLMEK